MNAQDLMKIINKLTLKKNRQAEALAITEAELKHWEAELDKIKKGK